MQQQRTVSQVESVEEIWETSGSGRIWVHVTGMDGKNRSVSVGGKPGMRLRISEYDRQRNQEVVLDARHDAFTNGMLLKVDGEYEDGKPVDVLTHPDIVQIFTLTGPKFEEKINTLNEYNIRRMREMCDELDATNSQTRFLQESIETRFPVSSGDTGVYRELKDLREVATDGH